MRVLISVLLAFYATLGLAADQQTFMPENNLHLQDNINANADIDEAMFNAIIDSVSAVYASVIDGHGKSLLMEKKWNDSTVNAFASQSGNTWKVAMFGGLARRVETTPDGFALVVCHELGHHLAGFAFYGDTDWAASEGQSDYFATQACAKQIWKDTPTENAASRATVEPVAKAACDSVWSSEDEQNLCYRSAMGGASLARLLAALGGSTEPQFDTPDTSVVATTNTRHPAGQCRMDTYFQGALCTADFDIDLIPAKNHPDGQTSIAAEALASQYACTSPKGYTVGKRPTCWFAAQLTASLDFENIRVAETSGNGNGVWEPGETIGLNIPVVNNLGADMEGATLRISSPSRDIGFPRAVADYPLVANGSSEFANSDILSTSSANMVCGSKFILNAEFAFGDFRDAVSQEFMLGAYRAFINETSEPNTEITDNGSITDTVEVTQSEVTSGISLDLNITHTYIGDLTVTLVSPAGSEYVVHDKSGSGADNIVGTFDINANEEDVIGTWTLRVQDSASQDVGTLNTWGVSAKRLECDEVMKLTAL
jgi:subtilisin-like proprotein convertase family protein